MMIPLLFGIDLLLFTRLVVGEKGEILPCRTVGLARKDSWMIGFSIWFDKGGYGGELNE